MGQKHRPGTDIGTLLGACVRSRRIQAGMSLETLGKAIGVTFQQVQKYEKGINRIGYGRLLKIAEVLECEVMDFFEGMSETQAIADRPLSQLIATKDGVDIIEAMSKIKDKALRRTVIDIVEKLAET